MPDKLQNDLITPDIDRNKWRSISLFILAVAMLLSSLFLPRAFLSVSMIVFIFVSFLHRRVKEQFVVFARSPFLWSMSVLFLLPCISGLWSEDQRQWLDTLRIKLPLLLMPLAFVGFSGLAKRKFEYLAYVFILLVTLGTAWSMWQYLPDAANVHEGYLRSTIIKTPLENDHVRFSWLVTIAIITAGWIWYQKNPKTFFHKWLLSSAITWLVIFLHILAARTGLICFYICLAVIATRLILFQKKIFQGALLLMGLLLISISAWLIFPTFQNRARYIFYELPYFKKMDYLEGANDVNRIISLKAGWNVMNASPLKGVGFGDIRYHTIEWYAANYPQMKEADKILPSSEWLIYGAGSGWPGFLIFSILMIIPFTLKEIKNRLPWFLISVTTCFTFLFDIGLEIQYGVFLYSFVMLWWWKWMSVDK